MLTLVLILILVVFLIYRIKKGETINPKKILFEMSLTNCYILVMCILCLFMTYWGMISYIHDFDSRVIEKNTILSLIIVHNEKIEKLEKEYQDTLENAYFHEESEQEWQKCLDEISYELYITQYELKIIKEKSEQLPTPSYNRLKVYEFLMFGKIPQN